MKLTRMRDDWVAQGGFARHIAKGDSQLLHRAENALSPSSA